MKQRKDGSNMFFYDTYALFAIATGKESYKKYAKGTRVVTTLINLYELYYTLIRENQLKEAEYAFNRFLPSCIQVQPEIIKESAKFKLAHQKVGFSYADCLGYIITQRLGVPFLTGDDAFKNLPNVEFVK